MILNKKVWTRMLEKLLDYLSKNPIISCIIMIFFLVAFFILYLIIKITLAKSATIWDWVSAISNIVTIIAIPSIAYQIGKLNKSFKEKFLEWNNKTDEKKKQN